WRGEDGDRRRRDGALAGRTGAAREAEARRLGIAARDPRNPELSARLPLSKSGRPISPMRVTIHLPDDISAALEAQWDGVPGRSLEAIAVEAYRTGALTESQVRRRLALESRFQVHALLQGAQRPAALHAWRRRGRSARAPRARDSAQSMIVVADSGPLA